MLRWNINEQWSKFKTPKVFVIVKTKLKFDDLRPKAI